MVWVPCTAKGNFTIGAVDTKFLQYLNKIDLMQHALLRAGDNGTVQMKIQYRHMKTSLKINRGDSLGSLVFIVYSPMQSVAGWQDVKLSIYASFDNAVLTTLTLSNPTPLQLQSGSQQEVAENIQVYNPTTVLDVREGPPVGVAKSFGSEKRSRGNVPHFEDVNMDVMELCKRFSPIAYELLPIPGGQQRTFDFELSNALFPDGSGTSSTGDQSPFGGGMTGWFASLYRAFRGDIRLKISIQITQTTT